MTAIPTFHIAIMQPAGYVHSLGLLDPARHLRFQLRRLGAEVTLAKNRLREDAVNIVLGAHLGFPAAWKQRHCCLFLNLEQLGSGGARVSDSYLQLLRSSAVVDYDAANVAAYAADPADVPIVSFLHAPYLRDPASLPLEQRPIDLLFFGSLNPRRQALLQRLEAVGVEVTSFDSPLYGDERDHFIRQSKAVLNCHYYGSSRFEQVRVAHCLSLGTPVVSERGPQTRPHPAFEDAVSWVGDADWERFFADRFATPGWFDAARRQLAAFERQTAVGDHAAMLEFAVGYERVFRSRRAPGPWRPTQLNLGSGRDYRPGWLNVDVVAAAEPDLVLDLGQPLVLPLQHPLARGGEVRLAPGQLEQVHANNVLEHVADLPAMMGNLLDLLKVGGSIEIEVPYEKAPTAWQDPTHLRAFNENSWLYYTDWFWYLGWFEHRFELAGAQWLNLQLAPCDQATAAFMRVTLRKVVTTPRERTLARTMRADFGGVADDPVAPADGVAADAAVEPLLTA